MDFGQLQVTTNIPSVPQKDYDPGNQFEKQVGDLFKLANSNKFSSFAGQSAKLDLNTIQKNPNLSEDEKYKLTEELLQQPVNNKTITPSSVSLTELDPFMKSRDFEKLGYKVGSDNYQTYFDNRSGGNTSLKIFNKFLTSVGVGGASAFTPIGTGLGYLTGTDYGKQWSDKLASWQEVKNDYNQIYYSDAEKQASGMNPFKTPTKFFDNLLPSLGFTVGNIAASYFTMRLGGNALMKGFSAFAKESELFRTLQRSKLGMYRGMKGMDALAEERGLVAGAEATVQNISRTTKVLQGLKSSAGNVAKILPYSFYSAAGEGHIEASMAKQEFYHSWFEDYKQKHGGALPSAEEQIKMTKLSEQVYDETLKYNTIVLSLTNTLEIGALVKKMGLTGELLKRIGLGKISKVFDVDDIAFKGFKEGWKKKTFKEMILPYTTVSTIEALGESFEEASQYAISRGVQTWATQKFNDPNAVNIKKDWLEKLTGFETDSFSSIASMKNIDDEMKSNAYFGFLSGLAMSGGTKAIVNPIRNRNTTDVAQKRIDLLNKNTELLSLKFVEANENKVNNYTQNAKVLDEAIKNGDVFALKNMEFADLYTWTANSVAAGGFDLRVEQLLDLKKLSKEDFESFFNIEFNDENRNNVDAYIDKVIKEGKEISKDIEQFRNTDNVFNYNEKPEEELTKEEKEENENFELFENVKYEMAYSYSRLKNFNKRNSKILTGLENTIGGTQTLSNLKRILFSQNGISEYRNILKEEIKTLQSDLKNLGTDTLFKEDFNKKQKEIKEKESILDSLNASKEDIDKWIEESKDTLTDKQKQNLLALTRRGLDRSNLKTILKYEMEKLHKGGIEFQIGDNKVFSIEDMTQAIETPILDIYNINSSKGIVLDKFNKLSTIKGAKQFIKEYKDLQDRFEKGTIIVDTFNDEFKNALKEEGYPDGVTSIGVNVTYFTDSTDTIEENERQLNRLNEANTFAISTIKEVKFKPKENEDKEEIEFKTKFIFADKEIELSAKTKEDLLVKIEKTKNNLKTQKYKTEKESTYIIKRGLKSIKNKKGEWVSIPSYEIFNKMGDPALGESSKKFTGKELTDFLKGINTLSNTNIRKYEIIPFSEFQIIQKTLTSATVSKSRLASVITRFNVIDPKIKELEKQLKDLRNSEENEMLNNTLKDVLNSNYLIIYELEINLQELLNQSKAIQVAQNTLNAEYKLLRGDKARWSNTKEGKRFKELYLQIQDRIKNVQAEIIKNKENLDIFNKENEKLFSFYNKMNDLQLELNQLLIEKDLVKTYGDKLVNNLKDLYQGTTTDYIDVSLEVKELKEKLFDDLSTEEIKNLTDELQIIGEKHEKLRVLKNQYQYLIDIHDENIKNHQTEINRIQGIIDELEETIQYTSEEDTVETFKYLNKLKPSLISLNSEIDKIKKNLEELNQKIAEIDNVIQKTNSSILEDFVKLQSIQKMFANVSRASALKESVQVNTNINDFTNAAYHGQRKSIIKNGKEIILEFEPIDTENAEKFKPNVIHQLTSQDITANISTEKVLAMTEEELDNVSNIEFHRFLSTFSSKEVSELFKVLIVTPASIKDSHPELYAHLENQFSDKRDMSETTDLFSVIIDNNTGKLVKQRGKFLTSSFYKAENKFKTNVEGLPLHITEKAVLNDFIQFSEQYIEDIENKSETEIIEYNKSKEILTKAIAFSKKRYEDEIDSMIESINKGKFLVSEIKDVTSGIFIWGNPKDVAKVMGITSENIDEFAIGIVIDKEGGGLTYLDDNGKEEKIGQNLNPGTTAIINKKTGEWIPLMHKEQDDKSLNNILGILTYVINEHQNTKKSILDIGKSSIPYGQDDFQLLLDDSNKSQPVSSIPLFPTLYNPKVEGRSVVLGELSKTFSARWSVITTLMNFGKDNKNPKNSIYFDEFNKLHYYDFNTKNMQFINASDLGELLNSYQNGKVEELTDDQKVKLSAIVQHIKQKRKNISYQYAFSTRARTKKGSKFLFKLPQYNAKTGKIEFKVYDSYLEYVIGLGITNSGLVQTKIEKVDNRTSFQKSIILRTDLNNRPITTEIGEISKEYLDITKVEAKKDVEEEKKEAEKAPIEVKAIPKINIEALTINENKSDIDEDYEDTLYVISPSEGIAIISIPNPIASINFKGKFISTNKLNATNKGKELVKSIEDTVNKLKSATDLFEKNIFRLQLKELFYKAYKGLYNIDLQTSQPKTVFDIPNGSIIEIENFGTYKVVGEFNFFAGNTLVSRNEKNEPILLTKELLEQGLKENKIKVTKAITETTTNTSNKSEIDKKADTERRRQKTNNEFEKFNQEIFEIEGDEINEREKLIQKLLKKYNVTLPENIRIVNWSVEELINGKWEPFDIKSKGGQEAFFGKENWDKLKETKKQFDIEFKKIEDSNLAKIKLIEQKQSNLLNTIDGLELRKAWSFGLIEEPNLIGLDETNFISKQTEFKNGDLVETDNYEGYYYLSKPDEDGEWYEVIIGKTEQEVKDKINSKYDAEQKESIIDEKTLEGFSSEEDLAKAFGVKPLEQSKNLEELTKEELWKELVDLGYDGYNSLEEYESIINEFGLEGKIEEILQDDINKQKGKEKNSFTDLTLNKILKENNITKNC